MCPNPSLLYVAPARFRTHHDSQLDLIDWCFFPPGWNRVARAGSSQMKWSRDHVLNCSYDCSSWQTKCYYWQTKCY
jgi:hypothetical protein